MKDKKPSTTRRNRKPATSSHKRPNQGAEPEQKVREYAQVTPGIYTAFCLAALQYFDPGYKRWTCLILFDLLDPCSGEILAKNVPWWLSLGSREKPCATRRGKYFAAWIEANGGPPKRRERMSPRVFRHRMARVRIEDTKGPAPYSRISGIESWETLANDGN